VVVTATPQASVRNSSGNVSENVVVTFTGAVAAARAVAVDPAKLVTLA